ncbi:MAG: hypothetical protein FWE19_00540 [Oscillospiraceae bacterium]|nr:hypothetical protein [Oscillospiraceae bacterium]
MAMQSIENGRNARVVREAINANFAELDSGKLDKVTSGGSLRVYSVSPDGQTQGTVNVVSNSAPPLSIPERNAAGTFSVGDPAQDNHPATKGYVDAELSQRDDQITALWQLENKLENIVNSMPPMSSSVYNKPFSNATFSGDVNAIAVKLNASITVVSFWGFAVQNTAGSSGQDFIILDPAEYPLIGRFVGQVDQFAIGYNAATNDFKYVPVRITSQGMFIVTAPNISLGTRFSFQFVLILAE